MPWPRRSSIVPWTGTTVRSSSPSLKEHQRNACLSGTIMCYGQTGAGKTHTMTGFAESYQNRGIIPRTLQHLYQEINARQDFSYNVR